MSGNMSTFKRFEKKYLINKAQHEEILKKMKSHVEPDEFDKYTICNIYYDTDNYQIIRSSIEKPVYKEKLRVRSYGTPGKQDTIFFELKKKYKSEVFKRRVSMSLRDFEEYLQKGTVPNVSKQVLSEIEYFMSHYKPDPKIYIAYERLALRGKDDPELRITFDNNIRFRKNNLRLSEGDDGIKILDKSLYLMEIKVRGAMPLWLSQILNEIEIYPTSFSKYGYCYVNYIYDENNFSSVNLNNQVTA